MKLIFLKYSNYDELDNLTKVYVPTFNLIRHYDEPLRKCVSISNWMSQGLDVPKGTVMPKHWMR